jgi:hypothetical protein
MHSILTGTVPVKPFDPAGFVGTVESDGQRPKVAAVACEADGRVICLSLVGAANSISSAMAKLLDPKGRLDFTPTEGIAWDEPRILMRDPDTHYKELGVRLRTTLHVHGLCLPFSAHLGDGLVHPPVIPQAEPPQDGAHSAGADGGDTDQIPLQELPADHVVRLRAAFAQAKPRYLLGNWDEPTPNARSFLGVLRGLRVIFINAPQDATPTLIAAMHQWADALWREGLRRHLITAIPSLGIQAWRLTGDLAQWSDLISEGVHERWLDRPISSSAVPHGIE